MYFHGHALVLVEYFQSKDDGKTWAKVALAVPRRASSYLSPHLCSQWLTIFAGQMRSDNRVALGVERDGGNRGQTTIIGRSFNRGLSLIS